jgi:hypothetical protein
MGVDMSVPEERKSSTPCGNCDQPAKGLGRLVRYSAKGDRIDLAVCRFCYVQLARHSSPNTKRARMVGGLRPHEWP